MRAPRARKRREKAMPLPYVDIIEGRTPAEIQALLDWSFGCGRAQFLTGELR
ncbi:MAG TPA: hypothetical protein VEI45_01230 [Mycobacterium sp.]|uniref:hypothetical protein n=1 Tax=Mycobacterium sp. TaxID=1785 RepID=UPI002D5AC766|nr:hypothetical protein [Mycobacterium sp.]HXY63000.1 hypothetical protein [Mycobacterium sp.]